MSTITKSQLRLLSELPKVIDPFSRLHRIGAATLIRKGFAGFESVESWRLLPTSKGVETLRQYGVRA